MDYKKQLVIWAKRRRQALHWVAKGVPRKEVAKRLGITRQRLSMIESEARK